MVDFSKIWDRQVQAAENNVARDASRAVGGFIGDIIKGVRDGVKEGLSGKPREAEERPPRQQPVRREQDETRFTLAEKRNILNQFKEEAHLVNGVGSKAETAATDEPSFLDKFKGVLQSSFQGAAAGTAANVAPTPENKPSFPVRAPSNGFTID